MDELKVNGVQYRQQYRKCGKPGCKCANGEGHGPYWYGYDGNSAAKYVGIKLPEHVTKHMALKEHPDTGGNHEGFLKLQEHYQLAIRMVQR